METSRFTRKDKQKKKIKNKNKKKNKRGTSAFVGMLEVGMAVADDRP